jgi:hypothetical protein
MTDKRWFAKELELAKTLIDQAKDILESLHDEASEKCENYPENLQSSEVYERMENRSDAFEEAYGTLDTLFSDLEDIE